MENDQFLKSVGFAISEDGRTIELRFHRKNGQTAFIQCAFDDLPNIVSSLGKSHSLAWQRQQEFLRDTDPREIYPLPVEKVMEIAGSISTQGNPILTVVAEGGLRLNLVVDQSVIPNLISWLEQLQAYVPPERPRRDN